MNIAIIPARSGSKGLPNKNIRLLEGIPLLAHSVLCAKQAGLFNEIFVSTDSHQYADIAVEYGGSVPFLREASLAGDTASMWDVVRDVLSKYETIGKSFDSVTLLQPTSPLRIPDDIVEAHKIYKEKNADSVISVCIADHAPYLCNVLPESGSMEGFISYDKLDKQRQQLPDYYRINGALYLIRCSYLAKTMDIYGAGSYAYIMPKERSVDIDDELDFITAETIYNRCKVKSV